MSIWDESSYAIIVNESNLDRSDTSNSKYVFSFNGTRQLKDTKIALSNVSLFYSWFNITSAFNNNAFSFSWTQGGAPVNYNVTIPDGYYSISDLNTYLQSFCITNNLYLVDSSGNFVYYIQFQENATYYSVQLNCYPVPIALPGGWTNPGGLVLPLVASTPQVTIPSNNNFGTLIGFNAQTFPTAVQTTTQSKLSDFTPSVNPVENVIIRCNLVNNNISNPSDVLYSFNASGVGFGGLVTSQPYEYLYLDVTEGYYSQIEISFVDQQYRAIRIRDPSVIVQLSFKTKKTSSS